MESFLTTARGVELWRGTRSAGLETFGIFDPKSQSACGQGRIRGEEQRQVTPATTGPDERAVGTDIPQYIFRLSEPAEDSKIPTGCVVS